MNKNQNNDGWDGLVTFAKYALAGIGIFGVFIGAIAFLFGLVASMQVVMAGGERMLTAGMVTTGLGCVIHLLEQIRDRVS